MCLLQPGLFLAKALYDNIAETPDELAFRRGDVLTVLEQDTKGLEGWWLCSLRNKHGIAPGNRLKIVSGMGEAGGSSLDLTKVSEKRYLSSDPFKHPHAFRLNLRRDVCRALNSMPVTLDIFVNKCYKVTLATICGHRDQWS